MSLQISVNKADAFDWLKKNRGKKQFDIIFADPPFNLEKNKYDELIALILSNNFLKEDGLLILEHQAKNIPEHPNLQDTRKYGNLSFSLFSANNN